MNVYPCQLLFLINHCCVAKDPGGNIKMGLSIAGWIFLLMVGAQLGMVGVPLMEIRGTSAGVNLDGIARRPAVERARGFVERTRGVTTWNCLCRTWHLLRRLDTVGWLECVGILV